MQHDSLIKMESAAGGCVGAAGTSSAMSPPSGSVGGNYFNLNSLIATSSANPTGHNTQSTSPISSSIILATSAQNHHGLHGNLLFDSMAGGGNTCPSSPTSLLTPSTPHHLTHLTPAEHHNHHHYLHYHHPMHHHHHHMSPHSHPHLAMPPQGSSLIMSTAGSQSPGGGAFEGQFQQQNYGSAKMGSPGSMEALNQSEQQQHRLQEVGGANGGGGPMLLGNSYSM